MRIDAAMARVLASIQPAPITDPYFLCWTREDATVVRLWVIGPSIHAFIDDEPQPVLRAASFEAAVRAAMDAQDGDTLR